MSEKEESTVVAKPMETPEEKESKENDSKSGEKKENGEVDEEHGEGLVAEVLEAVRNGSPPNESSKDEELEKSGAPVDQGQSEEQKGEGKVEEEKNDIIKEDKDVKEEENIKEDKDVKEEKVEESEEKQAEIAVEEASPKKDKKVVEEKDIVTPHLLGDDEIVAKGVAESDIEMYRKFHLKVSYCPKAWYDRVKNHALQTDFVVLSPDEINALLAIYHSPNEETPECSGEVKEVLEQLKGKIDTAIAKYGEDKAFIKLNTHSARDAILDKSDDDHIQAVEDALQNELEIEQQFVNAYLTWKSWRSMSYRENSRTKLPSEQGRGNIVRRSFRRIQSSFTRPRAQSATDQRREKKAEGDQGDALAEVATNGEAEGKKEASETETKEEGKKEASETETKEEGKKEVGETETKEEEKKEVGETETKEEKKGEETALEVQAEVEAKQEEEIKVEDTKESAEETAAVEVDVEKTADTEPDKDETKEEEKKSQEKEGMGENEAEKDKKVEKQADDELKVVEESKAGDEKKESEAKGERVPPPMLTQELQFMKVKSETSGNKVLRAFIRATTAMYRVSSGEEAIRLLSTSAIIKEDLEQAKVFANIQGAEASLSVQRWHADLARYTGMQFRGFVYKNQLNALSQKDDVAYIPNIARYKTTIEKKIKYFFEKSLKPAFLDLENYVVDIFVGPNKVYIVDLCPFYTGTGACLFTWQQNMKVLLNGPLLFRHIPTPYKNCFTGLQPHWQKVCSNAQQSLREPRTGKCVIL